MGDISRERFTEVYNKYRPNKWITFVFRYFSKETEMKDMVVSNTILWILVSFFILGFLGTVYEISENFVIFVSIIYSLGVFFLFTMSFVAVLMNNKRISKIRKELNLSKWEYNEMVDRYLN